MRSGWLRSVGRRRAPAVGDALSGPGPSFTSLPAGGKPAWKRRTAMAGAAVAIVAAVMAVAAPAGAQQAQQTEPTEVEVLGMQVNLLWVVLGAVLVIFMQAGFALVETGFCRAKHAAHVVSTNFAIFGLGFVGYFCVGYAFMFGGFSFGAYIPGYDAPLGGSLVGSGNWTFLWHGGFALSGDAITAGVLGM